ncbi:MAG: putative DNA binding domain-containing protein [Acidipropionibacterium sp.]|jgi:ATP-dependent DNA helicase RecG|nr:putative DNA binding domain-containing protein [Acidipropionibacterium sp.]
MNPASVDRALGLPVEQRANALIALPESQWYDRKSGRIKAKDLARHIVAFANAEGGVIALGLSDGRVDGVSPEQANSFRQVVVDHIRPPLRLTFEEFEVRVAGQGLDQADAPMRRTVMIIKIDPSPSAHETNDGSCFLRVGDESRRLSYLQRRELELDRGHEAFDGMPAHATIHDLDPQQLALYTHAIGSSSAEGMLVARSLRTQNGGLTVAADLLFGSDPQREFPSAEVRVLRYDENSRGTGVRMTLRADGDQRFRGSIPTQIDAATECIRKLMPTRQVLDTAGRFETQSIIPEEAWLEGLVNAVVHRSYSISGDHIRIELFPNRIEITSPGRFPGLVDPRRPLDIARHARNPRIARVCSDLGITRELGEGIRRIVETMRARGLSDPVYEQSTSSVHLTLMAADALPAALKARLSEIERRALDVLRRAQQPLSTGQIAEVLGVARPTAARHLRALRDAGLIVWEGQSPRDPRASWRLD